MECPNHVDNEGSDGGLAYFDYEVSWVGTLQKAPRVCVSLRVSEASLRYLTNTHTHTLSLSLSLADLYLG